MKDFINHDVRTWNNQVIDNIFLPFQSEVTKSLPLSWCNVQYKLIWPAKKILDFSVKYAYHMIRDKGL